MSIIPKYLSKINLRSNSKNIFTEKLKLNLTKYLMRFSTYKDNLQLAKTCIFNRNVFIEYQSTLKEERIQEFKEKYSDLEFDPNLIKLNQNLDKIRNINGIYSFRDEPSEIEKYDDSKMRKNYLQVKDGKISKIVLANCFPWAGKKQTEYWTLKKEIEGNYLNFPAYHLSGDICWIHLTFVIRNVSKGNYKLFLNTYFEAKMHNNLNLIISIGKNTIYKKDKWPDKQFIDDNFSFNIIMLKEISLFEIKQEDFDIRTEPFGIEENEDEKVIKEDGNLYVEFVHATSWWKSGWIVGGIRIEKQD